MIFNDTDAGGDTELGIMKIINGSNPSIQTGSDGDEGIDFAIFPNPNSGDFQVSGVTFGEPLLVSVFSAEGQLVFTERTNSSSAQINLAGWKAGFYWVSISFSGRRAPLQKMMVIN